SPAALPAASSWSVTLAIALTTTTGKRSRLAATIVAARSTAAASSTEVPPNFITIIGGDPTPQRGSGRPRPTYLHERDDVRTITVAGSTWIALESTAPGNSRPRAAGSTFDMLVRKVSRLCSGNSCLCSTEVALVLEQLGIEQG